MDYTTFITNYPEFANTSFFPQAQVNYYLGIAQQQLTSCRWGTNTLAQGLQLFTAHNLVLARRRALTAANGGIPGTTQGVLTGKSVDKVSLNYDTQAVTLEGGADWNLTDYGIQFLRLARMIGAGPLQL